MALCNGGYRQYTTGTHSSMCSNWDINSCEEQGKDSAVCVQYVVKLSVSVPEATCSPFKKCVPTLSATTQHWTNYSLCGCISRGLDVQCDNKRKHLDCYSDSVPTVPYQLLYLWLHITPWAPWRQTKQFYTSLRSDGKWHHPTVSWAGLDSLIY